MCERCIPTALDAYEQWRCTYKALSPEAEHLARQLHQSLQVQQNKATVKRAREVYYNAGRMARERIVDLWPSRIVAVHQTGRIAEAVVCINLDTGRTSARWVPDLTGEWIVVDADA